MTGRRIQLGHQLRVIEDTADGVRLEGVTRLRPGQLVAIVPDSRSGDTRAARNAWVVWWSIARLGSDGPTYHGLCRWQ